MSDLPRHDGQLDTDPFVDSRYLVHGLPASGFTYNAVDDRLESTSPSSDGDQHGLTIINSKNSTGEVTVNFNLDSDSGNGRNHTLQLIAFGYQFQQSHRNLTRYVNFEESDEGDISHALREDYIYSETSVTFGNGVEWRVVANNLEVSWYINDGLVVTVPARAVNKDVDVRFIIGSGFGGTRDQAINSIVLGADSSVPLEPVLRQPAPSGNVAASNGPIIWESPNQRIFVDLTEWAGMADGISSVIYDPLGATTGPTPMTEDTDGSGSGDYYFESPAAQGSTWRLVVKESFRLSEPVSLGDTIRFDVDGVTGANGVDRLVTRDDDLHFRLEIDTHPAVNLQHRELLNGDSTSISINNIGADGNTLIQSSLSYMFSKNRNQSPGVDNSEPKFTLSTISYPVLVDIDLGAVRTIKRIGTLTQSPALATEKHYTAMDIYSNTVPFAGASLGQGTLEQAAFPIAISVLNGSPPFSDIVDTEITDITARYFRFAFIVSYESAGGNTSIRLPRQITLYSNDYQQLDTDGVDAAQFEFSDGGAFVAFPGGGILPSHDTTIRVVRALLPPGKLLKAGITYYMRIRAKADLSD